MPFPELIEFVIISASENVTLRKVTHSAARKLPVRAHSVAVCVLRCKYQISKGLTKQMREPQWEHFAHQADMGVRGFGRTKAEAFENAALALTAVITDLKRVKPVEVIDIHCKAPDDELLFVDWLNALIYEMSTRNMLFSRFEVHLEGQILNGKAWGDKVDVLRHQPAVEVKGATYTALRLSQDEEGIWCAQCVVDV